MLVGVISDTHGTLPTWVARVFAEADLIIHAGDVGNTLVLDELSCIAPVIAVRGNTDFGPEVGELPDHRRLDLDGVRVLVVHRPEHSRILLAEKTAEVCIVGHTHRPRVQRSGDTLILNPGSASQSRGEGHSAALLRIENGVATAEIVRVR